MKLHKLLKHTSAKIGLGLYVGIWLFTIIGSWLLPMDPYEHDSILADLPPASSYGTYPKDLDVTNITDITSSVSFSVALMKDGNVVTWGEDEGISKTIEGMHVKAMAAGANHFVVVDRNDTIYEFEEVPASQTILNDRIRNFLKEDGVKEVYASDTYSACLSNGGYLFYWGATSALDLASIPDEHQGHIDKAVLNPNHVLYVLDDGTIHMLGRKDRLSKIPDGLTNGSVAIKDIAMSYDSVLVLDEHNKLHSWGETSYEFKELSTPISIFNSRHSFYVMNEDHSVIEYAKEETISYDVDAIYASDVQTYMIGNGELHATCFTGFPLGSDSYGRDILTRLVHGGLISLLIGLPACLLSLILSIFFGLISGYYGGKVDHIIMRLSECISSIPFLPIVITISAFLMDSMEGYSRIMIVMLLYGSVSWPSLARMIRTKVMVEKEKDYVLYEEMIGASPLRIMWKHIFPSTFSILAADITLLYASTLLMEASLSFLGFGVPPLNPSWGNMLQAAQTMQTISSCWWQWFFPALCVFLSILSIHLMAEALRKEIDVKE